MVSWESQRFKTLICPKYQDSTRIKQMISQKYKESTRILNSPKLWINGRDFYKHILNSFGLVAMFQKLLRLKHIPNRIFEFLIKHVRRRIFVFLGGGIPNIRNNKVNICWCTVVSRMSYNRISRKLRYEKLICF